MRDDTDTYRVTYANGVVGATCSRRSLAGKIGRSNQTVRDHMKYGYSYYAGYVIVKIERAPIGGWDDVTDEFHRLVRRAD